jgi:peptide/nickel transport system ATP-binding protein
VSRSGAALLAVDSLCVSLGETRILNGVSLEVAPGEILGLVGASGSGKSTTALAIMRLLPPGARMSGSVYLHGEPVSALPEAALERIRGGKIGMIFQEPMTALNPLMRIGEQVAETVRIHRAGSAAKAEALARETLELVGLGHIEGAFDRLPHELSGGQRQRAAIAVAMVLSPALLIADEPTSALDVGTQAEILKLLRELAQTRDMGLLLVSHDLAVISALTHRIAVMHRGEIVEQMATPDLSRKTHAPYTQALLAAAMPGPMRAPRAGAAAGAVLEVRDILRQYPRRRRSLWHRPPPIVAVDRASLTVHAGETVGLMGESGCGKSSLLRTILALDRPQAGEVRLLGEAFSSATGAARKRLRRSIQVVLQDPSASFDPLWRVERVIAEPYYTLAAPPGPQEIKANVAAALEQVGLAPADAARFPHEFSGGQRQRIAIARALILKPAVIAFDEALSALDVIVRAQILALLAELAARLELAYLFVSHDLGVVRSIADRVYVMQHGRIVEEGATERVFASPQHAHTRALLAAMPRIGARLA